MKKIILFTLLVFFALSFWAFAESGEKRNSSIRTQANQVTGRVFWRGMVDAKVHLIIQDLKLKVNTLDGTAYPEGVWSFTSTLPRQETSVGVNKTKGRGTATVIQQPNHENDYTAIVEIVDDKGGAKEYQIEVFWK